MTRPFTQFESRQPVVALLRAATEELHDRMHAHPLIVGLLTRPSLEYYQAVLEAFLRFYRPAEPLLIECSHRFGVVEQYSTPVRTRALLADLTSLGCKHNRRGALTDCQVLPELASIGALAGCLYVIKGSALGGDVILRQLTGSLVVKPYRRFFAVGCGNMKQTWRTFQRFCDNSCRCDQNRQAAIVAAKQTFACLAECLTFSFNEHHFRG